MPELSGITVKGFKSISSIENVKPGAINIIVGPNGSGKSNFIEVFSFLNAIREGRLQDYIIKAGGADRVLHFGARVTKELQVRISFQEGKNQYEIILLPTAADELIPTSERIYFWNKALCASPISETISRVGKEAGISAPTQSGVAYYVRQHLDRWRLVRVQ
jgi:predicted ATPase